MPHPEIAHCRGFTIEPLFLTDESGHSVLVVTAQSVWSGLTSKLFLSEQQLPVNVAGEPNGPAEQSSYKYEPQCAFTKPATDVILIGHAHACRVNTSDLIVRLRVGPLDKSARVTGDRYWVKSLGMVYMTSPEPFETIPLIYERAFGGWDRSHPDPDKQTFEPRNPVGTGFRSKHGKFEDGIRLPNLEDPRDILRDYGQTVTPAGFGFTSPHWQPRASFAGTYDERWINERMPLLPGDFDRRFFNAASPGLIANGYLKGDEPVWIDNVSSRGPISFNLPGVRVPECQVHLTAGRQARVQTNLDTVVIDTDEDRLILIWRGYLPVRNGPHDIVSIRIQDEELPARVEAR
jgi:hypothetical protein